VESLRIESADHNTIFQIPAEWLETGNFHRRQVNVVPLLAAFGVNSVQGAVGNAGIAFLAVMDGLSWVPAYWTLIYTHGMSDKEGQLPKVANQLIACYAAIDVLSTIAATNRETSVSLSQDGIGQSSSNPGPRIYEQRIEDLEKKKAALMAQLKAVFSSKYYVSNI
jgi:hypothetical protein